MQIVSNFPIVEENISTKLCACINRILLEGYRRFWQHQSPTERESERVLMETVRSNF